MSLTIHSQTELAGRKPRNWATVEAPHEKHNLHQLCRSEHTRCRGRLRSATHVLGILGISLHLGISLLLSILSISLHLPKIHRGSVCILWHSYACQSNVQVGRDGAMQLIAEEMSSRYSWPAEAFPRMMEERGFPKNQSDQLKGFHYR